jgi:hypothetical protein
MYSFDEQVEVMVEQIVDNDNTPQDDESAELSEVSF